MVRFPWFSGIRRQWSRIFCRAECLVLCAVLLMGTVYCPAASAGDAAVNAALKSACAWLYKNGKDPGVAAVGGDWVVFDLARCGYAVPQSYLEAYYARVEAKAESASGIFNSRKYSDNARVILSLTAIGYDPRHVAGCDLTAPLGDFDKTVHQGINGAAWALLALDSAGYPVAKAPAGAVQASRQRYVDYILAGQKSDGGWSLSEDSDVDLTAMMLQALAAYTDQKKVSAAVERGLAFLSAAQQPSGGYLSVEVENTESTAQVLTALSLLGVSPSDSRFTKNGVNVLEALLACQLSDGGFRHIPEGPVNMMATQQAVYALNACRRSSEGSPALFDLRETAEQVRSLPVTSPGKTFADVKNHADRKAIEALASRGIINGMSDNSFAPDANMTRAQFAAITVRALGLTPRTRTNFTDVSASAWYAPYVGTASRLEIVKGVSDKRFNPDGTITLQEAAVMVARAAKLCGMSGSASLSVLSSAAKSKTASWAAESMAFCVQQGILAKEDALRPTEPIRRCEIARMLYTLLQLAELL